MPPRQTAPPPIPALMSRRNPGGGLGTRQRGATGWPGHGARGTEYYRALSPLQQAQNFEKLRKFTQAFDTKYGTNLWDAIKRTASTVAD